MYAFILSNTGCPPMVLKKHEVPQNVVLKPQNGFVRLYYPCSFLVEKNFCGASKNLPRV